LSKSSKIEVKDAVTKRLDAIIRLLMEEQVRLGKAKKGDLLLLLASSGLSTGDIASIEGRPSKDIASWLRRVKRGSKTDE
jgi:DNA-directed RNA polymerase specialized sigma24 family protein